MGENHVTNRPTDWAERDGVPACASTANSLPKGCPQPSHHQRRHGGADMERVAADHGLKVSSIGTILRNSGVSAPKSPAKNAKIIRNEEIVKKYKAGSSTVKLAQEYGVSRERICQLLRGDNIIATVNQRRQLAREGLKEQAQEIRNRAKEERAARLQRAVELVKEGRSRRQAGASAGLSPTEQNLLITACRLQGLKSTHGRWRDLSEREARVRSLHAEGKGLAETVAILREEGDKTANTHWIQGHCADLNFNRHRRVSAPSVRERPAKPDPDSIWTEEKTAELRRLWLNGCSAQQISDIFGSPFTRNSIIGKVHRLRNERKLFTQEQP